MGDQVCEIEEIEAVEAPMATVREREKVNYNTPDFSDDGPHISSRDSISPTLEQNGGDKAGEERRGHRKGRGSGSLPLYLFLKESVAIEGGRKVDPRCPNASNPYHMCTDYCLTKMGDTRRDDGLKSPLSFLSRHSRSSSSDGSSRGAKVDPRCPNSSNPYHECTDNCRSKFRQTERENGTKSPFPFISRGSPTSSGSSREDRKVDPRCPNSSNPYHECTDNCRSKFRQTDQEGKDKSSFRLFLRNSHASSEEDSGRLGDNRKVDPRCPNSSNPYHECSDNCRSKFRQTDQEDKDKSSFRLFSRNSHTSSEANSGRLGDNRKVDPRCANASNPYHECTDRCFKKLQEGNHTVQNTPDSSTSRKSKGNVQSVERREGMHPECVNASNPYHKCSNNCFEKMQR